jgi:putative oxidoreductase
MASVETLRRDDNIVPVCPRDVVSNWWARFGAAAGMIVGGTMAYSAFHHLANPFAFLATVLRYQVIPPWAGPAVAICLPFVQLVIGAMLLARVGTKPTALASCILLTVFVLVQATAVGRGLEIPCGCFGANRFEPVGWSTISRTLALLGLSVLAFSFPGNARSSNAEA